MGVTELSRLLAVQKSTAHSLLQTLLARGFVDQTTDGRYSLGITLMQLGNTCAERLDIRKIARPLMDELASETGEIALLAVLVRGGELIIIEKSEPQRPFLIIPKFDFTIAAHSTAVGKVLLAHAEEAVFEKIYTRGLQPYTPYTLTDGSALKEELEKIKRQGYAVSCNETIDGISCIAAPIRDNKNNVVAALSISSASSIITPDRYEELVLWVTKKAAEISIRLGCQNS